VRFTVLDDPGAPYLKHAAINALCVTRDGSLWIASESNGVTRFHQGLFRHFLKPDGLPDNQIQCLLEGRGGELWLGGETGLGAFQGWVLYQFSRE
jgi:ligand-binding sensor domain-containing protein